MSNKLNLVERLEQAISSDTKSWIITEMLLGAYPEGIRISVFAATIPHWFNASILAALLDLPVLQATNVYKDLMKLSIVQPFGALGHTLHDLTRNGILTQLSNQQPELLRRYSQRVLTCFVVNPEQPDPQQEVEAIYHTLICNVTEGRTFLKRCLRTYRGVGDFAAVDNILRNYRELIFLGVLDAEDSSEFRLPRILDCRSTRRPW